MQYGYMRVSSRDQNEARQYEALLEQGLSPEAIYLDKQSGKDFRRPSYLRLVRRLRKGDVLYISSIDRLGRNYEEIQEQWRFLTKERQIRIIVLDMPLLNTSLERDLTETLIADIVLQLLSYVAQSEREMIHKRQKEGIQAAQARGVRFGRPPLIRPKSFESVRAQWQQHLISSRLAAEMLGISQSTFLNWCRKN